MKRIISLVAAAALATGMVCAQVGGSVGARGTFGMNLGTTLTDDARKFISQGEDIDLKDKLALGGGGSVYGRYNMPFHTPLGVQLEVGVFANNGAKLAVDDTFEPTSGMKGSVTGSASFSYLSLDIPLLITYDIDAGPVVITPFVGPNFSIPLGTLRHKQESTITMDGDVTKDFLEKSYDFSSRFIPGIVAGVAVGLPLGAGALVADLRYVNDFTPVSVNPGAGRGETNLFTRRNFDISLGYELRF